jgi:hypothetical protein
LVATRRGGRSKGFGFVLFGTEAEQLAAVAALDNSELEARPIAVKVAMTEFATEKARAVAAAEREAAKAAEPAAPAAAN